MTTAPITATKRLHRFSPVTPCAPKKLNIKPPRKAPTIPNTMSRMMPSPDLLTILLPMKPATRPRMIHASMDIIFPPQGPQVCPQSLLSHVACCWSERQELTLEREVLIAVLTVVEAVLVALTVVAAV